MRTDVMRFPVEFRMGCTRYPHPDGDTWGWHGQALLWGRPIMDLYECEGKATQAAAVRALKEKIREANRERTP